MQSPISVLSSSCVNYLLLCTALTAILWYIVLLEMIKEKSLSTRADVAFPISFFQFMIRCPSCWPTHQFVSI